jgi:hypothetical protein
MYNDHIQQHSNMYLFMYLSLQNFVITLKNNIAICSG